MLVKSFDPIENENSEILILGTMPVGWSIKTNEYYADPDNCFWLIISELFNSYIPKDYLERKNLLLKNKIAIWDVLQYCDRERSLDKNIKNDFPNDFNTFYQSHQLVKAVFFNGSTAYNKYKKHIKFNSLRKYIRLPSTSSTPGKYVIPVEDRLQIWKQILDFKK